VSQPKTYEASTIEEALRAVSVDLGDEIEIVEAVKERRGGMLGFFAREVFVVTARSKESGTKTSSPSDAAAEQAFSDMLLEMASGVADTWDGSTPKPAPLATRAPRSADIAVPQVPEMDAQYPLPDLPPPVLDSQEQYVIEVDGPMIDLRDSVPRWSLARLQMLHLPDSVLEAVEVLDPTRDLEWVQSLSIAISKLSPNVSRDAVTYVVGHGRRSAPELIRGIPKGRIPTAMIIDGVRIKVTPDELALSIRACIR